MHKRSLYQYYSFGYNYRSLRTMIGRKTVAVILQTINQYLTFIKDHDLRVTRQAIEEDLLALKVDLEKLDQKSNITDSDFSRIKDLVGSVDKTLDSELVLQYAYLLTEKRLGLNKLTNRINEFFAEGVYSRLPDIVKFDFSEAGHCIAFERPTAAAFHILRGCEGALKAYYLYKIKRERLSEKDMMWGAMVGQLRKKRNVPKPLLDVLDNIRVNFRNPTAHPEARYDLDEVQDLFNLCVDSVNRIMRDVNANEQLETLRKS